MAKMEQGFMGGFSGRLGQAVGYRWNGKWCLRSRPAKVANPRTEKQMAHRSMFKEEVRLAARMRLAVHEGMTAAARQEGMTCYNLFVSVNQPVFAWNDGGLEVDYEGLTVSAGPVAPVAFAELEVKDGNVLEISFEKNPTHAVANAYDRVMLFAYCPDVEQGYLSHQVYRRDKRLAFVMPDAFVGHEVHVYGFVKDSEGRCSMSSYVGCTTMQQKADTAVEPATQVTDIMKNSVDFDTATGEILTHVGSTFGEAASAPPSGSDLQPATKEAGGGLPTDR